MDSKDELGSAGLVPRMKPKSPPRAVYEVQMFLLTVSEALSWWGSLFESTALPPVYVPEITSLQSFSNAFGSALHSMARVAEEAGRSAGMKPEDRAQQLDAFAEASRRLAAILGATLAQAESPHPGRQGGETDPEAEP